MATSFEDVLKQKTLSKSQIEYNKNKERAKIVISFFARGCEEASANGEHSYECYAKNSYDVDDSLEYLYWEPRDVSDTKGYSLLEQNIVSDFVKALYEALEEKGFSSAQVFTQDVTTEKRVSEVFSYTETIVIGRVFSVKTTW